MDPTAESLFVDTDWKAHLSSPDPQIRTAAIVALQQFGPRAAGFIEQIVQSLEDVDRTVRERAASALIDIGGIPAGANGHLVHALADESSRVRVCVARALWNATAKPALILAPLIASLQDPDAFVRWNAAAALADMGEAAAPARSALEFSLQDRDDGVQMHAARALGNLKATPERVIPALIGLLREHSSRRIQGQSEQLNLVVHAALHSYGEAAVSCLMQALDEPGDEFRLRILSVLGHLGSAAVAAVPKLETLLADGNPAVRRAGAFVLGQIGAKARDAAHGLRSLLHDSDATVRVAAARSLWRMDAWSKEAFQVLQQTLHQGAASATARTMAIQALGQMGPAAAEIAPGIRRILNTNGGPWSERLHASVALWQIAGDLEGMKSCVPLALESEEVERRLQLLRVLPTLGAVSPCNFRMLSSVCDRTPVRRCGRQRRQWGSG